MSELKHLNLTERDFDLLVEGLEALPERGQAGELVADLIGNMITNGDPEAEEKHKRAREHRKASRENSKKAMLEDVKVLQGKLIMLKRYLVSQNALNQATDIINHIS